MMVRSAGKWMIRAMLCGLLGVASASGQVRLADDFSRPDGPVDNGWTSWWAYGWPADTSVSVRQGELVTHGYYGLAGGVFRFLPVTYPLRFAFDFRSPLTPSDNQCGGGARNEAAWMIALNMEEPSPGAVYPLTHDGSQLFFAYNNPLNYLARLYRSPTDTRIEDLGTAVEEKPYPPEVRAWPAMRVEGLIRADGSATIQLYFNDGQSPDPLVYEFPAISGGMQPPKGGYLALGNASCNTGEHIFDNFSISGVRRGPPSSKDECKNGGWELFEPAFRNQGQCIKAVK